MSILSSIFNKIFPSSHAATVSDPGSTHATPVSPTIPGANPSSNVAAANAPANNANNAIDVVDVEVILNGLAQKTGDTLNWRTSIVDLLKLLNLDSSLEARKELAQELHYTGDTNDSASMNIWLHRQVMNKLAANGGKVPADLKD